MPLSPQQKRLLKQRGQTLADGCQLGKARLTDEFLDHLNGLLDRDELVKMRFAELEGSARKELAKAVSEAVNAECVQVVGRTVLMYRKGRKVKKKAKGRNPGSPGAGAGAGD